MSAVRKIKDPVQNNLVLRRAIFAPFMKARFFLSTAHRAEWVARIHELIVGKSGKIEGPQKIEISKKPAG
jgi:hypothetical protein